MSQRVEITHELEPALWRRRGAREDAQECHSLIKATANTYINFTRISKDVHLSIHPKFSVFKLYLRPITGRRGATQPQLFDLVRISFSNRITSKPSQNQICFFVSILHSFFRSSLKCQKCEKSKNQLFKIDVVINGIF